MSCIQFSIDDIHLPAFLKSKDGVYLKCNEAFLTLLALPEREVVGKTDSQIFSDDAASLLADQSRSLLQQFRRTQSQPETSPPRHSEQPPSQSVSEIDVFLGSISGKETFVKVTAGVYSDDVSHEDVILGFFQDDGEAIQLKADSRASEEKYHSVIESSKDGFLLVCPDGQIKEVNNAYCKYSGYSQDELLQLSVGDLEQDRVTEERIKTLQQVTTSDGDIFDSVHRRKDGSFWPVEISASYSDINDGCFLIFVRDITERRLSEELSSLRHRLSEMVYNEDSNRILREALDTAERLTYSKIGFFHFIKEDAENLSLQTWSTRTLKEMCYVKNNQQHYPISQAGVWVDCIHEERAVIHNDYPSLKHKKGMPDGHPHLVRELTVPLYRHGKIAAVIGLGNKETEYTEQDIHIAELVADLSLDYSERIRAEQQIKFMAYYDPLTNLPNRELFSERLNTALENSKKTGKIVAVCYLDLDCFKPINDQHGHSTGDKLLSVLANRLKSELRKADTLARLGGDEFAFILNGLSDIGEAEEIVKRVLINCSSTFDINGLRLNVSASVGITCYPQDDSDADGLLRNADQTMYQAKNSGKNNYRIYAPVMVQRLVDQERFLAEFNMALQQNQLVLHYQPKIDLNSCKLAGVEALVRWNHPEKGLLPPARFLPLLESTPLEAALDEWVIKQALEQHMAWKQSGLVVPVSVNITPGLIQKQSLPDYLKSVFELFPKDTPEFLELEVLETSAINDLQKVSRIMRQCVDLGVSFSLDDFGTGFSSLTYFHSLPVDVLKIDQKFVRSMLQDPNNYQIVEGVVSLAAAINRPVVAEGVESKELAYMLSMLGCRFAQGFGIAKPMAADKLFNWSKNWKNKEFLKDFFDKSIPLSGESDLDIAILSIINWKNNIKNNLLKSEKSINSTFLPSASYFTQWYHGIGEKRYGNKPQYPFLLARHDALYVVAEEIKEKSLINPLSEKDFFHLSDLADDLIQYLLKLPD